MYVCKLVILCSCHCVHAHCICPHCFAKNNNYVSLLYSIIVDRIDKDKDGFVTKEELENWVRHVSHRSEHFHQHGTIGRPVVYIIIMSLTPEYSHSADYWCLLVAMVANNMQGQFVSLPTHNSGAYMHMCICTCMI